MAVLPGFFKQFEKVCKNVTRKFRYPYIYYGYTTIINGQQCFKAGITKRALSVRVKEYLKRYKKRYNSDKIELIYVIPYRTLKKVKEVEKNMKRVLKKAPLCKEQHGNTEQYNMNKGLDIFSQNLHFLEGFDDIWLNPNYGYIVGLTDKQKTHVNDDESECSYVKHTDCIKDNLVTNINCKRINYLY